MVVGSESDLASTRIHDNRHRHYVSNLRRVRQMSDYINTLTAILTLIVKERDTHSKAAPIPSMGDPCKQR